MMLSPTPNMSINNQNQEKNRPTVMVLDDEPVVRDVLQIRLERANYHVLTAGSYQEYIEVMTDCDIVLCDIILSGDNGLQVLEWTRQHYPDTLVVMMTGEPSYETAAQAIRLGAYDYLAKPINKEELLSTLARAVEHRRLNQAKQRLETENEAYRQELEQRVAERTQALRESENFLTSLTNTMADAVFSLKMPEAKIEYANQATTHIFGYQPEELLGQSLAILHPDQASFELFRRKQVATLEAGQSQMRLEQLLRHKEGSSVWTETATTFIHSEGKLIRAISVVRDITQRSLLLGMVAHELRGPLALLTGFSQAMQGDIQEIDQGSLTQYLDTMHRTATRMLKLVDDLLEVAEMELGHVLLEAQLVDLSALLQAQASDYQYLAHRKNIKLSLSVPEEPLISQCDPVKIGQVISNFIDNAIKYSAPETTIEMIGRQYLNEVWVGVKDQGPGVKSEEIQYLFKSFGRTKISSRPTGGEKTTGLGLVICKKIVEAHHGKIGVETVSGQGSTFWFSLPLPQG